VPPRRHCNAAGRRAALGSGQWTWGDVQRFRRTVMRHEGTGIDVRCALLPLLAQAPPTRAFSMFGSTGVAALIPLSSGVLLVSTCRIGAGLATQ